MFNTFAQIDGNRNHLRHNARGPVVLQYGMSLASLALIAVTMSPQSGPPPNHSAPMRNTFVIATESVLDQAAALELTADAATFDPEMKTVQTAEQNLEALAADERESAVVHAVKDMLFDISSCRIQAIDGADISRCLLTIKDARVRAMQEIGKHKDGGAWVDGRP